MKLEQLMEGVPFALVQGSLETEVTDIIYDSRKAAEGMAFVCIVGTQRDSHDFAPSTPRSRTGWMPRTTRWTTHRRATSSPSSARAMRLTVTARASRPPSSSGSCWKSTPSRSAWNKFASNKKYRCVV